MRGLRGEQAWDREAEGSPHDNKGLSAGFGRACAPPTYLIQ